MVESQYICKRCKHAWVGRKIEAPVVCPKCKRYTWNDDLEK